ncbi:MAG: membrane protein insertion efficiency factor YidD [Lysobacterales bacterium]
MLAATAGFGWAAGFVGALCADGAGLAAFFATALGIGFAAGFFAALVLGAAFLTTALPGDGFLAADFPATTFFDGAFFAGVFLAGTFLAGVFFAGAFFAATFLAGAAFFAGALAAAGLDAAFFAACLAAGLADVLLALFTIRSLPTAIFDLPAPAEALADVFPLCALAAVELALVFAISLHRGWPWRPRVIADVSHTGKCVSGILVPLHAARRSGNVNILTRLILWLLRLYKRWLSPLLGTRCRFHPTCSDYARIAVTRFGPWRGSLLTTWRLLRCQPLCEGGEDPVPEHFHFRSCRCQGDSPDAP